MKQFISKVLRGILKLNTRVEKCNFLPFLLYLAQYLIFTYVDIQ